MISDLTESISLMLKENRLSTNSAATPLFRNWRREKTKLYTVIVFYSELGVQSRIHKTHFPIALTPTPTNLVLLMTYNI
jgi:hypothetical protein